ncbi:Gfo/Idh/MocA family oxidoreductase [Kribbella sp. NPDC051952]|uniref:Gfo/Idh/MocA family protein n=1 Tax=Kribbella sp. NPDC051952 TaxID=3154851 RepID=UPI003445BD9F
MTEIRMAVVGLGPRATGTWIPLLRQVPGFRIVAVHDPLEVRTDRAMELIDDATVTRHESWDDVLADPAVDAIALTVRCREQGAMAAEALEAGKHVHAEVPAAHSIEDCWRIALAAERSGLVYQLAEQTRYWGFVDAWRELRESGRLGTVTLCEAQYFHYHPEGMFIDPRTGDAIGPQDLADHPDAIASWTQDMPPIHYLPHSLSPMLKVLDDRVVEVVAMSTESPSLVHPELTQPDLQMALMKTRRGTILRMATSFVQPHPDGNWHWYQVSGTAGHVEWKRSVKDSPRMWLAGQQMHDLAEVDWRYERTDAPRGARGSGHGDADYYTQVAFRDAVLGTRPPEFDVYAALETAAPAILAATSIERGSVPLRVPDFRPGPDRAAGQDLSTTPPHPKGT